MAFIKPPDKTLEHLVKQIVSKNYPNAASRGIMNTSIGVATHATQSVDTGLEGSGPDAKELFIWGTSMWGGSRVIKN